MRMQNVAVPAWWDEMTAKNRFNNYIVSLNVAKNIVTKEFE